MVNIMNSKADFVTDDRLKIYIDQLRDGQISEINETFPPEFIDICEADLAFRKPVSVNGQAYLADDTLILHLKIATVAQIACTICNKLVDTPISIPDFYHAEPLDNIKGGTFNFHEPVREAVLLDTPPFAECNGSCPARKELKKYLKSPEESDDEGYHPFADL